MTEVAVRVRHVDDVAHIELQRPDRLNAVSEELYAQLAAALVEAVEQRAGAVLLSGAGRAFCSGADLKAHATRRRTAAERRSYVWAGQHACRRVRTLPIPVIGAIHGYAIGAGAELALSCDMLVCAEDAQFRLPEISLGTFVGGGVTHRLPRLVGEFRARQLLFLGEPFTGTDALEWGIAHSAVPAGELMEAAWGLARSMAAMPRQSMRLAKAAFEHANHASLDDAMMLEADSLLACMETDDWQAGVERFGEGEDAS